MAIDDGAQVIFLQDVFILALERDDQVGRTGTQDNGIGRATVLHHGCSTTERYECCYWTCYIKFSIYKALSLMDNFFRQDVFFLLLFPCLGVFLLFLMVLSDKQVSRVTVFFFGLVLIALAAYIAHQLMTWRTIAELLLSTPDANRRISKATLAEYDRWSTYVLWLIPFVTGALGTNLISDAITKPLDYKKPFSFFRFASTIFHGSWMLVQLCFGILITPFLLLFGLFYALKGLRSCPRRWRVYAKLYRRSYLQSNARPEPPWKR